MKTIKLIIAILVISVCSQNVYSQTIKQVRGVPQNETKAERKAREKRLKAMADSVAFIEASNALDSANFVITADRMTMGNSGRMFSSPNSSTNFILLQGDEATVQIAFDNGAPGLNGLGGITVEGAVSGLKRSQTKKGDLCYDFSVQGVAISAQISIVVYKGGNSAMAIVSPNFHSQKLTVYGPLIPYKMNA